MTTRVALRTSRRRMPPSTPGAAGARASTSVMTALVSARLRPLCAATAAPSCAAPTSAAPSTRTKVSLRMTPMLSTARSASPALRTPADVTTRSCGERSGPGEVPPLPPAGGGMCRRQREAAR